MKKLNGIILGLIIILLLVTICVGVVVFIKKDSESNSKISKLENQITEIKSSNKINVENNVDNEKQQNQISNITKNDYEIFAKNLKKQISKYDNNNRNYKYVENDIVEDGYEIYLTKNGELFVNYLNKELNTKYGKYKIADNVLMFYIINCGQDVGNMLYFINEDGTVGMADTEYGISSNNTIKVEKDIGYKNIVSIVNGGFGSEYSGVNAPIFIDINGNIFAENLK